jgi:hypothetical protein
MHRPHEGARGALVSGKPTLGVMPEFLWREQHPDPDGADVADRCHALDAAIRRRLEAAQAPPGEWLFERAVLEVRCRLDVARGPEASRYWTPNEAGAVACELDEIIASFELVRRGGQR